MVVAAAIAFDNARTTSACFNDLQPSCEMKPCIHIHQAAKLAGLTTVAGAQVGV